MSKFKKGDIAQLTKLKHAPLGKSNGFIFRILWVEDKDYDLQLLHFNHDPYQCFYNHECTKLTEKDYTNLEKLIYGL